MFYFLTSGQREKESDMKKAVCPPEGMAVMVSLESCPGEERLGISRGKMAKSDESRLLVNIPGQLDFLASEWRHLTDEEVQTLIDGRVMEPRAEKQIDVPGGGYSCASCEHGDVEPCEEPCVSCMASRPSNWMETE
jgi:hypothetical protein